MPAIMKKKSTNVVKKQKQAQKSPNAKLQTKSPKKKNAPEITEVKKVSKKHVYDPIKANRGVVYINHIPHGFYENQLKTYFAQFGAVTRVRVGRSEKSGKSKGFAFVEFRVPEVAKIAAETMDNYLMFKKVLKTTYIPPEQQQFNYFRSHANLVTDANGVEQLQSRKQYRINKEMAKRGANVSDEQHQKRVDKAMKKLEKQQKKLDAMNIDVDLNQSVCKSSSVESKVEKPSKEKKKKQKQKQTHMQKEINTDTNSSWTTVSADDQCGAKKRKIDGKSKTAVNKLMKKNEKQQLAALLEKTMDSEDSEEDEDYMPNESEIIEIDHKQTKEKRPKRLIEKIGKNVTAADQKSKKGSKNTLAELINETLDESSDDSDFDPDTIDEDFSQDDNISDDEEEDENEDDAFDHDAWFAGLEKQQNSEEEESFDDQSSEMDDDQSSEEESSSLNQNKSQKNGNSTLTKLLNETLPDTSDSDDDDFEEEDNSEIDNEAKSESELEFDGSEDESPKVKPKKLGKIDTNGKDMKKKKLIGIEKRKAKGKPMKVSNFGKDSPQKKKKISVIKDWIQTKASPMKKLKATDLKKKTKK